MVQRKNERQVSNNDLLKSKPDIEAIKKDMEFCWFAYGFHPDEYMFFDLGGVNKDAEKRRSFVSEQERWCFRFSVNDFSDPLMSDKADTFKRFSKYYHRNELAVDKNTKLEDLKRFLDGKEEFVQKYVSSSRGQAVKLICTADIQPEKYLNELKSKGHFLLEDKIIQSQELNQFGPSIHNIRVSTFRTRDGILPVCGFFTMGTKDTFVVNATIGCVFASIDCKTGLIESDGCDELGNRYSVHPSSKMPIKGYKLPSWDEAIDLCIEIAKQLENFEYVSFDLAHTEKGWDVIEINSSGQFLHQAGTLIGFRDELYQLIEKMDQIAPYRLRKYE